MKLLQAAPDGGAKSGVRGYFLIEHKKTLSIVLLRFEKGTREAFHEHAFNALTVWLKGRVLEHHLDGPTKAFRGGQWKLTPRSTFHKLEALETTWAISFRGPWVDRWREWRGGRMVTLTHGRKEVPGPGV
ncbi:hypothetical protein HPY23_28610 [Methylobacterium sp. IF7SW-B2]|uniref:cupin domain-containing protein n=1 Tax=Methylobacterium ajmalii TaxID=2738439 RepID=UPI00190DCF09|nr:hypothetical protein [Methylobacterium ajmalii]MBK3400436.1 hypothetical protein [Methylobacterium ajmalii]MBK3407522.1 hypothetical protein [Methylobacterium ajmalii]MBZ6416647.1 hypothetical protein [Methylobacterium sp.]